MAGGIFSRAAITATAAMTINSNTRIWIVVIMFAGLSLRTAYPFGSK